MIHLNKSKCINCNNCIRICPFRVLSKAEGYPALDNKRKCLDCYHCVAICPTGAMTSDEAVCNSAEQTSLNKEFQDNLDLLIKTRRSIRRYKETPVPKNIVERVLDVVKMCPSAKNQQASKWAVVSGIDKTNKIMTMVLNFLEETHTLPELKEYYDQGLNVVTLQAPSLLFVYADKNVIAPQLDCTITLTTAELLLQAQGIGTCHAGYLRRISNSSAEIQKFLGIPEGHEIYGVITMGYADDESYLTIPERNVPEINWI